MKSSMFDSGQAILNESSLIDANTSLKFCYKQINAIFSCQILCKKSITLFAMSQGEGIFWNFTPDKDLTQRKTGEVIANHLVDFVKKNNIHKSLQAIGDDSKNVNIGWEGKIMHWVEVKLNRKYIWLFCAVHTNELPLRPWSQIWMENFCFTTTRVVRLTTCMTLQQNLKSITHLLEFLFLVLWFQLVIQLSKISVQIKLIVTG